MTDVLDFAKRLIAAPSVTPATGAVFDAMEDMLAPLGFTVNGQLSAKIERSYLEARLLGPIIFHSKVCADHREGGRLLHFRIPAVGLLRCNFLYKIHSDETAKFSSSFDRFFLGDLLG